MRREVPLIITFVVGVLVLLSYIISGAIPGTEMTFQDVTSRYLNPWNMVIMAFAVGLASANLFRIHVGYVTRKRAGYYNSVALLISMMTFLVVKSFNTLMTNSPSAGLQAFELKIFNHILTPLGGASFALLAFYLASASYRAFRARSWEAATLLVGAILVMLGAAPIGALIWGQFPVIQKWLMDVPNVTGQRAIIMGAAIGGFATSLRLLLGIDRGYLGGGD